MEDLDKIYDLNTVKKLNSASIQFYCVKKNNSKLNDDYIFTYNLDKLFFKKVLMVFLL